MEEEICKECKSMLVLDEEYLCASCELKLGTNDGNVTTAKGTGIINERVGPDTLSVDCGVCKSIVEEDSEGLFCDVCNTWFHNNCNKSPLHYDLYALLNDAPQNVKWFCDKCIWNTEKWIAHVNDISKKSTEVRKVYKEYKKSSTETRKECGVNSVAADEYLNGIGHGGVNVGNTEGQKDKSHSKEPEIKLENDQDQEDHEYMDCDYTNNSIDSDEWIQNEERKDIIKIKTKKKRKKSSNIRTNDKSTNDLSIEVVTDNLIPNEEKKDVIKIKAKKKRKKSIIVTDNLANVLDISEENLANLIGEIQTINKPQHKRSKCSLCPIAFIHLHDCIAHKLKVHDGIEKPYKCSVCEMKYFESKKGLISHMNTHNPDNQFPCEICSEKFRTMHLMKKHIKKQHVSDKTFECNDCGKQLRSKTSLDYHVLTHLPVEERIYPCDECDKRFNTVSSLKNHKESHSDVIKVICDICGKGFRDPCYLKRHMMIHNDEWPLTCEICGKGFRNSGDLDLHVKYHKKIVIATCHMCGYGAPTKYILKRHIKQVHTNEKPFECDICGNRYKTKENLIKHKRGIRGSCKGLIFH